MQITQWNLSELVAKSEQPLSAGMHTLQIENATYDDDRQIYTLVLRCVDTDQVSSIRYFVYKKDGTPNNHAIGTLNTLGKALFTDKATGVCKCKGIPFMDDILDGVVRADVAYGQTYQKADGTTGQYINIYEFLPVDTQTYEALRQLGFKLIDQYTEG